MRYDGLTAAQQRILGWIAMGAPGPFHPKPIAELLRRGLIEPRDVQVGRDRFGPIVITQYEMPLAEHMRWCAWCAANYEALSPDDLENAV